MISSNYSLNLFSPNFKGTNKVPPEVKEKLVKNFRQEADELIRKTQRTLNSVISDERALRDPFISPSEKMEIIGSSFSKMLAKVLRFFNM